MHIMLTGGTGYIGSAVLRELIRSGHEVTAVVRSHRARDAVRAAGATASLGDLRDADRLAAQLRDTDGAIHAASTGDETSAEFDRAMVAAVIAAYRGTPKPYVHTGGTWVLGSGNGLTEDHPLAPPAISAWRVPIEDALLAADVAATVLMPSIAFGRGGGIPTLLTGLPRSVRGEVLLLGDGNQHWSTVHVDDLARLFVLVLGLEHPVGRLIGTSGVNPTVAELVAAAVPGSAQRATGRADVHALLGEAFGDALLLDQQASGAKARSLGWRPSGPTLVHELSSGQYADSRPA